MKLFVIWILAFSGVVAQAQDLKGFNLYHPGENPDSAIAVVVEKARTSNKHVLIQIGGNWCIWCARFNDFILKDKDLEAVIKSSYEVYHLNFSKENKNLATLAKYSFPQRFGFPVFLILDQKGQLIHTQNSGYLEEGKSYSREKVMDFLQSWTPGALDPGKYTDEP